MAAETVLVRVNGPDRPGILAGVLALMAAAGSQVQDIEQITIRGHLDLSLVATVPVGRDLLKELLLYGWDNQIAIAFELVDPAPSVHRPAVVVTVLAGELGPAQLAAVANAVAEAGGNIERIIRLARQPVHSYELLVTGGELAAMKLALIGVSRQWGIDVAVQREGLHRRAARLVVLDVDSTLIQDEVIDLLARAYGCETEVAAITESAMAGDLDFEASLRQRVKLLAGCPETVFEDVRRQVRLTPGARTFVRTLRRLGYRTAIVSGGFTQVTDYLQAELGLDHAHANTLEVIDGVITGQLVGPIVDRAGKAAILRRVAEAEGIPLDQVVAIGDGANDLDMLEGAGLGVAFNAKPAVREAAQTAVNVPYLDAILFLLGVRREDVEEADDDSVG
ncbi:MAG: serB [Acidimicrobiia bacterium]|nr:serB [Acidimicrobiia bacterium]